MAVTQNIDAAKGKNAGGAIGKGRFVKLDTTAADRETVIQCSVDGESCFGVSMFSVSLAEIAQGKGCSVVTDGRAIVQAAAAIDVGVQVTTDVDGKAKAAAAGDQILGITDEPSLGADDYCSVYLDNMGLKA